MSTLRPAVLLMTLVVTLTACASDDDEPTSSTEDTPSSPSASQFVSERHGYHLEVPAGWDVTEYGGTWTDFAQFSPGAEVPGEDVVSGPDSGAFLVSNSMVIPEGMSPDEWLAELAGLVGARTSPGCRGSTGTDVVAGEPARVIGQKCEDMHVVGRSLTHAGRGYYFTIGFPTGDSATEATLEGVVDSIGLD